MLVPNWLTCLLLGTYAGQRTGPRESGSAAVAVVALAAPLVFGVLVPFDQGFPFRALPAAGAPGRLVASAGVTLLYAGGTWLMYRCASRLPRLAVVEFLAKQTVFIFVSHMPVFYWLMTFMGDWPRPLRAVPLVVICYVGLALLGALFYRALRPVMLREAIGRRLPWPA